MRKIIFVAGATSIVSLAAGFAVGYKLAVHRLNDVYNEQMEEEIRRTRDYYERNTKPFADPVEAVKVLKPEEEQKAKEDASKAAVVTDDVTVETLERVVNGLKYNKITPASDRPPVVEVKEEVVTTRNIFDRQKDVVDPEDDPNYDEMVDDREHQSIYIVTHEEHMENPHELETVTLTYYAGDNVLSENDKPVEDVEATIGGVENLQFGRWSKDANVVFIRNETLAIEYEILRSSGKYTVEVLGLDED